MTIVRPLVCALLLVAAPGLARAQDETRAEIAMQNQILELRQDIDSLRAQIANGSAAPSAPAIAAPQNEGAPQAPTTDITAQLLDRVSRLEEDNRALRGAVDEARNALQQQNADLSKQIADLSFRVQTLEGGSSPGNASPGSAPSGSGSLSDPASPALPALRAPAGTAPAAAPLAATPKPATLQSGYAALARRDYPGAEAAARAALRSPHGYDAQYLLAQSFAGQRDYQQAALAYDDTYTKQRTGAHAPQALAGLANALAALGDKPAACATLNKLHAAFPAPPADVRASAAATGRKAGCK